MYVMMVGETYYLISVSTLKTLIREISMFTAVKSEIMVCVEPVDMSLCLFKLQVIRLKGTKNHTFHTGGHNLEFYFSGPSDRKKAFRDY